MSTVKLDSGFVTKVLGRPEFQPLFQDQQPSNFLSAFVFRWSTEALQPTDTFQNSFN